MKKILLGVSFVALFAGAASFVYRDQISMLMAFNKLKPAQTFSTASGPASPDYSQAASWAALPDHEDSADALGEIGVIDQQASAPVDVFFIHSKDFIDAKPLLEAGVADAQCVDGMLGRMPDPEFI